MAVSIALAACGVLLAFKVVPYQIDDAAIYYRYAVNLADGHGARFNASDAAQVEGFSSPLWQALLALAVRLGLRTTLPSVTIVAGLSAAIGVAVVVGLPDADARSPSARWAGVVALALWGLSPPATFHAVAGLETLAFALVVALVARFERFPRAAIVAAALSSWARPEGPVVLVMLATQVLVLGRGVRGWWTPPVRAALLAGVAGTAALFLARRWLFASWLPNPYYAKPGHVSEGAQYVALALHESWAAVLFSFAVLGAISGEARHRGYLAAAAWWLVVVVVEGGDWMPAGRLLAPAVVCAALAASGIVHARLLERPKWSRWAAVGVALPIASGAVQAARASWALGQIAEDSHATVEVESNLLADWFGRSGARSVALVDVGATAVRSDLEIVDLGGLTDRAIGRSPGDLLAKRFDLGYVFEQRRPDLVVVRVFRPPQRDPAGGLVVDPAVVPSEIERRVLADARLRSDFRLLFVLLPDPKRVPFYANAVFARRAFQPRPGTAFTTDLVVVK